MHNILNGDYTHKIESQHSHTVYVFSSGIAKVGLLKFPMDDSDTPTHYIIKKHIIDKSSS